MYRSSMSAHLASTSSVSLASSIVFCGWSRMPLVVANVQDGADDFIFGPLHLPDRADELLDRLREHSVARVRREGLGHLGERLDSEPRSAFLRERLDSACAMSSDTRRLGGVTTAPHPHAENSEGIGYGEPLGSELAVTFVGGQER